MFAASAGNWSTCAAGGYSTAEAPTLDTLRKLVAEAEERRKKLDTDFICTPDVHERIRRALPLGEGDQAFGVPPLYGVPVHVVASLFEAFVLAKELKRRGRRPAVIVIDETGSPSGGPACVKADEPTIVECP